MAQTFVANFSIPWVSAFVTATVMRTQTCNGWPRICLYVCILVHSQPMFLTLQRQMRTLALNTTCFLKSDIIVNILLCQKRSSCIFDEYGFNNRQRAQCVYKEHNLNNKTPSTTHFLCNIVINHVGAKAGIELSFCSTGLWRGMAGWAVWLCSQKRTASDGMNCN